MSHFAVIAPPLAGHQNPMQALASALVRRGHRVTFLHAGLPAGTAESVSPAEPRNGIAHRVVEPNTVPAGTLSLYPLKAVRMMAREAMATTAPFARAMTEIGADGALVDQLSPAGALAAMQAGIPHVSVANALLINRDPMVPPPFTDWRFDATPRGLRRNRGGWWVHDALMRPLDRAVARAAQVAGVSRVAGLEDTLSRGAQIAQTVAALDFPRSRRDDAVHHAGPLRDDKETAAFEPPRYDTPLVFASLGTLQGHRASVFRRIAAACARLGIRLLVAHGGRLPSGAADGWPGSPDVRDFVPQRAVLGHAAAVITHGGMNTVMDALAAGLPPIVVPFAFEQAAIGARLVHAGAGQVIPPRRLTIARMEAALIAAMSDLGLRAAAKRLQAEIAAAGGAPRAAAIAEAVLTA